MFPTQVGLIPSSLSDSTQFLGVPHTGGGDPEGEHLFGHFPSVFPTQVGVIPVIKVIADVADGVPHTGGGDPFEPFLRKSLHMCSPHRWG